MKISKYTFLFEGNNNDFYAYNSVSNALIEIESDLYHFMQESQKSNSEIEMTNFESSELDMLRKKRFITLNDDDNFQIYKSTIQVQRNSTTNLHLTIAPTMDCNFNCYYCFEKCKTNNYMSERTMEAIIQYLKSIESKPQIRLTWFGGEPLLALSQMELMYSKLRTKYKQPYDSNIITTGFHLDSKAIETLNRINIKKIQITLDGARETHNKIKQTIGCSDEFGTVLNNAEMLLRKSQINVVFRINLTKQNATEYVPLYNYLINRFGFSKNVGISPAFVLNRDCTIKNEMYFNPMEASDFVLNLYKKYQIFSPFLSYPTNYFNECAIRNIISTSFDPDGYVYKCWEYIGNKKYAIGQIDDNGIIRNVNQKNWNKQLYEADPLEDKTCKECRYLPICNGGCPIQRLENKFEGRNNICCSFYRWKLIDILKINILQKKY